MEEVSAFLADEYQEPYAVRCGPAFQPSARKFVGCCINMFPTSPDFAAKLATGEIKDCPFSESLLCSVRSAWFKTLADSGGGTTAKHLDQGTPSGSASVYSGNLCNQLFSRNGNSCILSLQPEHEP